MKCWKCGKEMERENGRATLMGVVIEVKMTLPILPEDVDYCNKQLGKYSNGKGECKVGLCYECYIDGLFGLNFIKVKDAFLRPFPPKNKVELEL